MLCWSEPVTMGRSKWQLTSVQISICSAWSNSVFMGERESIGRSVNVVLRRTHTNIDAQFMICEKLEFIIFSFWTTNNSKRSEQANGNKHIDRHSCALFNRRMRVLNFTSKQTIRTEKGLALTNGNWTRFVWITCAHAWIDMSTLHSKSPFSSIDSTGNLLSVIYAHICSARVANPTAYTCLDIRDVFFSFVSANALVEVHIRRMENILIQIMRQLLHGYFSFN